MTAAVPQPPRDSRPRPPRRRRAGFTLVEVTVALGILATGILILVALMPRGLDSLQEASRRSMGRRIAQNIISDMLLHDWDQLHTFNSEAAGGAPGVGVRFFDDYGIELTSNQSDQATFRVRVRVNPRDVVLDHISPLPATSTYSLPDDSGALPDGTVTNLRRVSVDITAAPIPFFDTPANFGAGTVTDPRVRTYSAVISNVMDIDSIVSAP